MTIEAHWQYYIDVLKLLNEKGPLHRTAIRDSIARSRNVTPEELAYSNERGTNIFGSRIHWAQADLVGIGALERPARGEVQITDFGRKLLRENPSGFSRKFVTGLPEWASWKERFSKQKKNSISAQDATEDSTPTERIDSAISEMNDQLAAFLVKKIQELPPVSMEKLVLNLLHSMGYGADEDDLEHLGGPGDEGVDGVINLDKLGLQKIYVQAKRYKDGSSITPTTVQAFIGALDSKRAVGGVFITTSDFTKSAVEAAKKSSRHIELIDGVELGRMMIEQGVGTRVIDTIRISEVDLNYFDELEG